MTIVLGFVQIAAILAIAGMLVWAHRLTRHIRLRGRTLFLTGFFLLLFNRIILILEKTPVFGMTIPQKPGYLLEFIAAVGYISVSLGTLIIIPSLYVALSTKKNIGQSDERYKLITENISDVIFLVDLNFNWLYITPSVYKFRGFHPDEALQQKVNDVLTPESIKKVKRIVRKEFLRDRTPGLDPGRVQNLELEFYHKDGTTVWGEVTASFLRDEEGRIIGLQGANRDITKRREAEKALHESEERFRKAFMLNPEAVALNRLHDGMFIEYNQKFLETSGYENEDLDGKTMLNVGIWADMEERERFRNGLVKEGTIRDFEARFRRKNGEINTGLTSATIVHLAGEAHVLTITKDISEIRAAQIALKESEERLRSTLEAIGDCVIMLDKELRIAWANDQAKQKLGTEAGMKCHHAVMRSDETCIGCNALLTFEDGKVRTKEMTFGTDGNGHGTFLVTCAPVYDSRGEIASVVETIKDINELKTTEARLVKTIEEKESLLKEIHHRVKNNLQAISGLLDIQALRSDDPVSEKAIRESQNRILSMAMIHEHLYRHQDLSSINFFVYTQQLAQNLKRSYGTDKHSVQIQVQGEEITLNPDTAIPCSLILTELVSNAFQHAFKDGDGTIEIGFDDLGHGNFQMRVTDTGGNFPTGMNIHSTDSFGLMLVRTFVELLGGKIEVVSGNDTSFIINFREYEEAHTLSV